MRCFNIAVNGVNYAVEVDELKGMRTPQEKLQSGNKPARQHTEATRAVSSAPVPIVTGEGGKTITAPMPGTILNVKVSAGMAVSPGDVLAVLEAMKMENEITAHKAGIITDILVTSGSLVTAGEAIMIME